MISLRGMAMISFLYKHFFEILHDYPLYVCSYCNIHQEIFVVNFVIKLSYKVYFITVLSKSYND